MVMFHSYVSLPEGNYFDREHIGKLWNTINCVRYPFFFFSLRHTQIKPSRQPIRPSLGPEKLVHMSRHKAFFVFFCSKWRSRNLIWTHWHRHTHVCIYIYMVCIYIYVYNRIYIYMIYIHTRTHTNLYLYIYTCIYMIWCICIYIYIYA